MSFAAHQIALKGSAKNENAYKLCNFCEERKPPEGGIQLSPRRWLCAVCWVDKTRKQPKKK
jgi:hypothetical protein